VTIAGLTEAERIRAIDLAFEAWADGDRRGPLLSPLVWSESERHEWLAAERRIAIDIDREGIPV